MKLILLLALALSVQGQNEVDENTMRRIDDIFPPPKTKNSDDYVPDGYDEIPQPKLEDYGASEGCEGTHKCVPYHMCDGKTNTIVESGVTDGFGIINIRFGANSCPHFLDVCCKSPTEDVTPNFTQSITEVNRSPATDPPPPVNPDLSPSSCGIRNDNGIDFKISGNRHNEAEYGEFPWMVAILNHKLPKPLVCGGSLITPNVVLTTAHCVRRADPSGLTIRAGEWDTQTTSERLPYQERGVREIVVHPDFNAGNLHNDFAVLILDQEVTDAENVGTVCLPQQYQRFDSRNCFVNGWGKTCSGDGGSPLVCPDPQNSNRYIQVGMVAWGIGCGEADVPGVYADVSQFREWIDQQLSRLNINNSPYIL